MIVHLIVKSPFSGFCCGDKITDAKIVDAALAEHPDKVLKVAPGAQGKGSAKK